MVIVTFECTIADEAKRDEIFAMMAALNELNQAADGCLTHEVYANVFEPSQIRGYIEYESYEKLSATEKDPVFIELAGGKFSEFMQAGALTMDGESLRRYELGTELPSMRGTDDIRN